MEFSFRRLFSLKFDQDCRNLKELFVRKNKIATLSEVFNQVRSVSNSFGTLKVLWLRPLRKLSSLMMSENPCSEGNSVYRHTGCNICKLKSTKSQTKRGNFFCEIHFFSIFLVLRTLPQLKKLDNIEVNLSKSTTKDCS